MIEETKQGNRLEEEKNNQIENKLSCNLLDLSYAEEEIDLYNKVLCEDAEKQELLKKRKILPIIQGCNSIENYKHLNKIHEGTFGAVSRAVDRVTQDLYAVKQIKLNNATDRQEGFPITSIREINLLVSMKHPNIVNVREVCIGEKDETKIYVVMEYVENELKDLMNYYKHSFTIPEVKTLMKQLLEAVNYLHENCVIHRDLKTSNLLYSKAGVLKVCDFGLARKYNTIVNKPLSPVVVTLWYRAPEVLLGSEKYGPAVDVWSIGCIFAELLLHKPLFSGQGENEQLDLIFKALGTPTDQTWPGWRDLKLAKKACFPKYVGNRIGDLLNGAGLSEIGLNLLKEMLLYDPKKRISAKDALKHPWFQESPLCLDKSLMPTFAPLNDKSRDERKKEAKNA